MSRGATLWALGFGLWALVFAAPACGKKGPPLPPLVTLPAAPTDLVAARRGSAVDIEFTVPSANVDGTGPGDVARVDVYGLTGSLPVAADEVLKRGTKVGSVDVMPPPDPDEDPDAEQPAASAASTPETGIKQGARAHVTETITAGRSGETRSYVSIAFNKRGRRGAASALASVPLVAEPAAPPAPEVSYTEAEISISWPPAPSGGTGPLAYHVYQTGRAQTRLTPGPLPEGPFVDRQIEWGAERCYALRAVETVGGVAVESEASPPTCVTLSDSFPPAPPTGLTAVPSEGSVNLIWNPSPEADLAGYRVLRSDSPGAPLQPITETIQETTHRDTVPAGARVSYAVQAIDKAGNISPMSDRIDETAR